MNDELKTTTEVSGPWECFSDPCYYDMARLRRKDGPKDFNTGFHLNTLREAQELRNILNSYEARLAPAPEESKTSYEYLPKPNHDLVHRTPASEEPTHEGITMQEWYGGFSKIESTEPANPTCANTTHKFSHCDCEKPTPIEPVPEWRELGPDEEIHTGDQVQAKHHDRLHGVWLDVFPYEAGAMPIDHEAFRYRTRRPLPKQEVPLDDELKDIDQYADKQNDFHTCRVFQSIEYSLHYLRDEIQKLKEAKP
jgi:hypothetical protein